MTASRRLSTIIGAAIGKKLNRPKRKNPMANKGAVTIKDSGVCINMLFALEGAIQGIRWHDLDKTRKRELNDFFRILNK